MAGGSTKLIYILWILFTSQQLQAGVDISTIAIWLGHESIETTHKYMVADIEIKRRAMEKLKETSNGSFSYKPSQSILAFLELL